MTTPSLLGASLLAGTAAVLAVLLAWRPPPRFVATTTTTTTTTGGRRRPGPGRLAAVVVPAGLVVVALGRPRLAVLVAILAAASLGAVRVVELRRTRTAAAATSARVLETCELLAGELAAGQPPGPALDRAAEQWTALGAVAEAHRVGADVPAAWRGLAQLPGAGGLRQVAAAWQISHRTGGGLVSAVDRVATDLREAAGTRRVVQGELASARATARLVAGLPVLALVMGSGTGSDPWAFLLGTPVGLACLAAGLAFALTGVGWIELIARDVERQS